jgi:transposase-like protein
MESEEGLFGGTVEVDATFHGGAYDKRRKRAAYDKQAVAGVIQRKNESGHSKVKAYPVPKEIAKIMTGVIRDNVAIDAAVMTDEHGAYMTLTKQGWKHEIVAHSKDEWVRGNCHTQGIESFWSLFKRGVIGSFHQVSVKHLHRYLNEFTFRFNNREAENIFAMIVMNLVIGTALRYDALTAPVSASPSEPSVSE